MLEHRASWRSVRNWGDSLYPLPAWAARKLAAAIRSRVEAGLALIAELEHHAEMMDKRVIHRTGFMQQGADGRNKQGRKAADPE